MLYLIICFFFPQPNNVDYIWLMRRNLYLQEVRINILQSIGRQYGF